MRYLVLLLLGLAGTAVSAFVSTPPLAAEAHKLEAMAKQFQMELGIPGRISVIIVQINERLASVQPSGKRRQAFILEIDEQFLKGLTERELRAMIAHEVGHVWIFTHRPYIQSEPLANEKAEKLVSPESLAKLYEKVWRIDGEPGTLRQYLSKKFGITDSENAGEVEGRALLSFHSTPADVR